MRSGVPPGGVTGLQAAFSPFGSCCHHSEKYRRSRTSTIPSRFVSPATGDSTGVGVRAAVSVAVGDAATPLGVGVTVPGAGEPVGVDVAGTADSVSVGVEVPSEGSVGSAVGVCVTCSVPVGVGETGTEVNVGVNVIGRKVSVGVPVWTTMGSVGVVVGSAVSVAVGCGVSVGVGWKVAVAVGG